MSGASFQRVATVILAATAAVFATGVGLCETTAQKNDVYPGIIPFNSPDKLDQYSVSGFWFPKEIVPYAGLSGPAVFVFKNEDSGVQSTIAVNEIALLDEDFWSKREIEDADRSEPAALVEKLAALGTLSIPLSRDQRAKVVACKATMSSLANGVSNSGQCLQLGDAAADLQEIDFSGKKSLLIRQAGMGQRGGDAYEVLRIADDPPFSIDRDTSEPFSAIDWRTIIDVTRRQIVVEGSSGACDNEEATYSLNDSGKMAMTHFWRMDTNSVGDCLVDEYTVESRPNGLGRTYNLLTPWKGSE